jgi:transcriptional regulator with XRE-family HTH domain
MVTSKQPLHLLLGNLIDASGKTQRQIATEIGYRKPNVISMMKQGQMPVPLEKVPALAKALNVEPRALLRCALQEYDPILLETIEGAWGLMSTQNEQDFIRRLRAKNDGQDIKYPDTSVDAALDKAK